ncbi:aminotransferase class III-fold pyridoxal phosphate-dependent enzyme [Pseudomonadales bacterium]|nr:aminotransferase class III-fold pyridoxal phosphate-dependent enzyme [Pseudomonadales bacterium]
MKIVAIVQARMGSKRLPGKVMKLINGRPLIELLLTRLRLSKRIDEIVIATSDQQVDSELLSFCYSMGCTTYSGSETDVLNRYYEAAVISSADTVVRVTGDCPLIDCRIVDDVIDLFIQTGSDYCSNAVPPTFPDGLDVEVFSFDALREAQMNAVSAQHREHVTPWIREQKRYKQNNLLHERDLSDLRWTVDELADFRVVSKIFDKHHPNILFSWLDVLESSEGGEEYLTLNQGSKRNEGLHMSKGQKLYTRAKGIIPGGNMLLSKRPEMHLPELWPAYFSRAKGCDVWDLEGRKLVDMSIMGVGTNILGYGHDEVDKKVKEAVSLGNMSTLNCPEEVYLAERLIGMHPWADMAKFARTGGEANAVAIRIARAASGKDNVAICGYHGWHDWYLSANLGETRNLDGHLLPGLDPQGVPAALKGTVFTFQYGEIHELEALVRERDIGVIKMEVIRNREPKDNFLVQVRELATKNNIVLIFDECTSGFRQSFGGIHLLYGVEPDMCMFGKALGNGYAITAVIGRREVMDAAQTSFISSTFWTERIGPTAALATLDVMEETRSWEIVTSTGDAIRERWQTMAEKFKIPLDYTGISALAGFAFSGENARAYKTLLTQEMLTRGFLAGTSVYVSVAHNQKIIDSYFESLESVFSMIEACENGQPVEDLLKGPLVHDGFKRLN